MTAATDPTLEDPVLARLASFCYRRKWWVLGFWVVALVAFNAVGSSLKDDWAVNNSLPGTDTQRALDTLKREFPALAGQGSGEAGRVVYQIPGGIDSAKPVIEAHLAAIDNVAKVTSVVSPFQAPGQISSAGTIGYAELAFEPGADFAAIAKQVKAIDPELPAGSTLEFSGFPFYEFELPPSEVFGLAAAVVILLIGFGSVVAAGLPLVTAILGIATGMGLVFSFTAFLDLPQFTPQVASMIGIGVGIDYALFIVTRFRVARKRKDMHDAVVEAIDTAGRAVLFAGITVAISVMGMMLMGFSFLQGLALGTASVVAVMVVAALTFVPALLSTGLGRKIDKLHVPFFGKESGRETIWHRWSRTLQGHAWPAAILGVVALVVLAAPLLALRLGVTDDGNYPTTQTVRRSYDLIAEGFGPGSNGPFLVTVETSGDRLSGVEELRDRIAATEGVIAVTPAQTNPSGNAAVFSIIPATGPQEVATEQLVHHLRDDIIPDAVASSGLTVYLGGNTPGNIDFARYISDRLPIFIGAVLILSFLLLMAVFRSVLVPLKAVIMNLLSIGGAYGVITAIFQWGWLGSIFGVGRPGPVEPWIPMMLFAIVFGLSMDYEVFLLSRIREEYDRARDNSAAVVEGLASTARVITAAAAIMVAVFLGFVAGERQIKLMGIGLATAVFLDATIVRMILVPATMELLGDRNWWFPHWLDRIVPRLHVETARHTHDQTLPEPASAQP